MPTSSRLRWRTPAIVTATLALGAVTLSPMADPGASHLPDDSVDLPEVASDAADGCPSGYIAYAEYLALERAIAATRRDGASDLRASAIDALGGVDFGSLTPTSCVAIKHPERYGELMARSLDLGAARMAGAVDDAAFAAAVEHASRMQAGSVPGTSGRAFQYGQGPLIVDDPRYGVAGLGLVDNAGRVDDLEYDPASGRLFAAVGSGGVWMSDDLGDSWTEINGNLPSIIVYSVAWTTHAGGRLVIITGDGTFGGITGMPGFGAYYSDNLGVSWTKATGVPDGALGFRVAVNPAHPEQVYAATSRGLFRSTDGGATYVNVDLPTGTVDQPCTGVTDVLAMPECSLANVVTDVVVQEPGGLTGVTEPKVVAAVGWRGGDRANPDGTIQSPNNGIYVSDTGAPGSFTKTPTPTEDNPEAFAQQSRIGRTELGIATGDDQDHNFLYAIVQDAAALNGLGCPVLDAPEPCSSPIGVGGVNTVLEGIYVSGDFGLSWRRIADESNFQTPTSGSALNGTAAALGFQPGVQAWYNQCVVPDPTVTAPGGIPGRLIVCLEEVWQNEAAGSPTNAPNQSFKVIGRYFSGETCLFLNLGTPACPASRPDDTGETNTTTTHPDQHAGLFVIGDDGTVNLLIGDDGGVFRQSVPAWDNNPLTVEDDFDNGGWGDGAVQGFQTLLPYQAVMARDGVVWFGLQDNGTAKIVPEEGFQQFETIGGDGFFAAVDPDNSDVAYSERPGAAMDVTSDGGQTWTGVDPPAEGGPYRFSNPFVMDPTEALHLATAGSKVYETTFGPGTGGSPDSDWVEVFDLGTASKPGDPEAVADDTDALNTMTAIEVERDAVYVGFCGVCDILNSPLPFKNGLATNVRGDRPQARGTGDGWHIAAARGLPNRFITSIAADPHDVDTVYVTLGGYSRRWASPGTLQDDNANVGTGHVFRSIDAGENFVDVSGNLPDVTVNWIETRGEQMIVGTDVGAFASATDGSPTWAPLAGIPKAPVFTIQRRPGDPNFLTIASYGRGVWAYTFDDELPDVEYAREAGVDRVATSIEVSQAQFAPGTARAVTIARADAYPDALAGVPLAWWADGPMLLTGSSGLDARVRSEVQRLGVRTAYVLGGSSALTPAVESGLRAAGVTNVVRLGGSTRNGTAALIAAELPPSTHAYVVEGNNADPNRGWPDALAVAPLAAYQGDPILLVERDAIPSATAKAFEDLGLESVTIVGGPAAVSDAVAESLADDFGLAVKRLAGADRYETSRKVADVATAAGLTDHRLWLATGTNFPDALSAGPAVVANGGLLLLVNGPTIGDASLRWIRDHSPVLEGVRFLGGEAAISSATESRVRSGIAAGPAPEPPPPPLVGEVLQEFTFEGSLEGWTSETNDPTGATKWQVTPPGDASGSSAGIPVYNNESTASMTSPGVPFPGGSVKLSFSRRVATEPGFDFVTVSWSTDGQVFTGLAGYDGFNPSYPAFDREELTFVAPAGTLFIRFTLSSDQLVNQEGAYIDNLTIER